MPERFVFIFDTLIFVIQFPNIYNIDRLKQAVCLVFAI